MKRVSSLRGRIRRGSLGEISGAVALHDAVAKGKTHLAKFILDAVECHSLVDVRDAHGKTPLIRAIRISDGETRNKVVDLLISYNASVNLLDNVGRSALSYACELSCNKVIRKLVQNNVDPNIEDNVGNTPLMYCAVVDNAEGIVILSRSFRRLGLEVDKVNAEGMTPLMEAARLCHLECARLLAHVAKASVVTRDVFRNMNAAEWAHEGGCSSPEVEIFLPGKQRTCLISHIEDVSCDNAVLGKLRNGFDCQIVQLPPLPRHSAPASVAPYRPSPAKGVSSEIRNEARKRYAVVSEELSPRIKGILCISKDESQDTVLKGSGFPRVLKIGKQQALSEYIHEDTEGSITHYSKVNAPPSGLSLTLKGPQPPGFAQRPCSAAAVRPALVRRRRIATGRHSISMEDLLLISDNIRPASPNGQKITHADARGIDSETHIDVKILPGDQTQRPRTSSQPLPCSYTHTNFNSPKTSSTSHLPPIAPHRGPPKNHLK